MARRGTAGRGAAEIAAGPLSFRRHDLLAGQRARRQRQEQRFEPDRTWSRRRKRPVCRGKSINLDDHRAVLFDIGWTIEFFPLARLRENPGPPAGVFLPKRSTACSALPTVPTVICPEARQTVVWLKSHPAHRTQIRRSGAASAPRTGHGRLAIAGFFAEALVANKKVHHCHDVR
jgi:hypothetical protein